MKILNQYKNGNYDVTIFSDGTKIRETQEDEFIPEFSENIDIKITDYCDANCAWCHEKSTGDGIHGNLNLPYFETLHSGTELAIGGGNPLSHKKLIPFLKKLKKIGVISNITVNQFHFEQEYYSNLLDKLIDEKLVYGVGVSMKSPTDKFIDKVKKHKNIVIHTINGINPVSHFNKLSGNNLKILILGYKNFGRGIEFANEQVEFRKNELFSELKNIISGFSVVSFDNLAIKQLNPKRFMLQSQWDEFYMGDDGKFTFYIDAVKNEFAKNSTSTKRYIIENGMSVQEMFNVVKMEQD